MNDDSATSAPGTSLRHLSRQFAEGKLSFNEYRAARQRLLEDVVQGATLIHAFQPAQPPLATRVAEQTSLGDTHPTIPFVRPRKTGIWKLILLIALLLVAIIAGIYS
jgi:hypothetical protein